MPSSNFLHSSWISARSFLASPSSAFLYTSCSAASTLATASHSLSSFIWSSVSSSPSAGMRCAGLASSCESLLTLLSPARFPPIICLSARSATSSPSPFFFLDCSSCSLRLRSSWLTHFSTLTSSSSTISTRSGCSESCKLASKSISLDDSSSWISDIRAFFSSILPSTAILRFMKSSNMALKRILALRMHSSSITICDVLRSRHDTSNRWYMNGSSWCCRHTSSTSSSSVSCCSSPSCAACATCCVASPPAAVSAMARSTTLLDSESSFFIAFCIPISIRRIIRTFSSVRISSWDATRIGKLLHTCPVVKDSSSVPCTCMLSHASSLTRFAIMSLTIFSLRIIVCVCTTRSFPS
mmetsp:Transcript_45635/g.111089  ORF Transcript_45635/g.111089 Transcript_45635/m.111089 type:complete len:355 (-) Transcript_45635:393-1457(-)